MAEAEAILSLRIDVRFGTTFDCDNQIGPFRLTDRMEITGGSRSKRWVSHVCTVTPHGRFPCAQWVTRTEFHLGERSPSHSGLVSRSGAVRRAGDVMQICGAISRPETPGRRDDQSPGNIRRKRRNAHHCAQKTTGQHRRLRSTCLPIGRAPGARSVPRQERHREGRRCDRPSR